MTDESALIRISGDGATMRLGPFTLTPTGLEARHGATFEEWEACGARLRVIRSAADFWLGDWLAYGEAHYGERYAQAVEATGYEETTLRNVAYVARSVDPSRRRDGVPFAIHQEVAPLPPEEQERWLAKAESEQLTRAKLRSAIRQERLAEADTQPAPAGLQPDGSFIGTADDGPIRVTCRHDDHDHVTLAFERPAVWVGMSAADALALARLLEEHASQATVDRASEDAPDAALAASA